MIAPGMTDVLERLARLERILLRLATIPELATLLSETEWAQLREQVRKNEWEAE